MKRHEFLNRLIEEHGFKDYLEIGLSTGHCFKHVEAKNRSWIDPRPHYHEDGVTAYPVDSDTAFAAMADSKMYDLIFIDGAHRWKNVIRDFENSFKHLSPGGIVVLHDCNPQTETAQLETPTVGDWNGDVWVAFALLRAKYRDQIDMLTVDTDQGLGVAYRYEDYKHVPKSKVRLKYIQPNSLTYPFLDTNRKELLSLLSVEHFWTWHKNLLDFE